MEEIMIANEASGRSAGGIDRPDVGGGQAVSIAPAQLGHLRTSAAMPGEMALQSAFGHLGTQGVPQRLVQLVGHRVPLPPGASPQSRES
jgi:hypothetical protein